MSVPDPGAFARALAYEIAMCEIEMKTVGSPGGFGPGAMLPLFATPEQHAAAWAEYHRLVAELNARLDGRDDD